MRSVTTVSLVLAWFLGLPAAVYAGVDRRGGQRCIGHGVARSDGRSREPRPD